MCSGLERHHLDGHVLQLGEIADLFELDASNVRRAFRRVLKVVGLNPWLWTPRELRHSFVSLLSDASVPIEVISRLVGHSSTDVTEKIYRHQIRPIVEEGADAMDRIFPTSTVRS